MATLTKPSITYLIYNTKKNGGNTVIVEHVKRLKKKGYHVTLSSVFGSRIPWEPHITITPLHTLITKNPNVLVVTFWITAYIGLLLRARKKFYFLQAWEEDFYRFAPLKKVAKLSLRFYTTFLTTSTFLTTRVTQYRQHSTIHQLPGCGINTHLFTPQTRKKTVQQKIHILSVVSSYRYYKGIDILTTCIKKLKKTYPNIHATLISLEPKPYDMVFDTFVGNPSKKELIKHYQESDVLLLTSRSEGFCLPILEAMACGLPVITTDSLGIRDYVIANKNALVFRSPRDLVEKAFLKKVTTNQTMREKLITNGKKTAKRFRWEKVIQTLEKILRS